MAESESLEEYWSALRPNPRRGGRGRVKKLENEVFGLLTVIRRVGSQEGTGISLWKCRCRCGRFKIVPRDRLVRGSVKSCGCLRRALLRKGNVQMVRRRRSKYAILGQEAEPDESQS
jgi:hypothetical protein